MIEVEPTPESGAAVTLAAANVLGSAAAGLFAVYLGVVAARAL